LTLPAGAAGVVENPLVGLNFVWNPRPSGLLDPATWLAAAGQNFFTLSVGMGSIQCYAAYLKANEDIALNAASTAWMTEFVEIILGGSILIPIATAYLGLPAVAAGDGGRQWVRPWLLDTSEALPQLGLVCASCRGDVVRPPVLRGHHVVFGDGTTGHGVLEDEFQVAARRRRSCSAASRPALGFFCVWLYPGGAFRRVRFLDRDVFARGVRLGRDIHLRVGVRDGEGWEEITCART